MDSANSNNEFQTDYGQAWKAINQELADIGRAVASHMEMGLLEVAEAHGGPNFRARVLAAAHPKDSPTIWPHPDAFRLLEEQYPEAVQEALDRASQIADEDRARQDAEQRRHRVRNLGQAIIRGISYFDPFGSARPRRHS